MLTAPVTVPPPSGVNEQKFVEEPVERSETFETNVSPVGQSPALIGAVARVAKVPPDPPPPPGIGWMMTGLPLPGEATSASEQAASAAEAASRRAVLNDFFWRICDNPRVMKPRFFHSPQRPTRRDGAAVSQGLLRVNDCFLSAL